MDQIHAEPHEERCGARNRAGKPCRRWPVEGRSRCRLHGGCATGPRTPEGLERLRRAMTIHGRFSKEAVAERKRISALVRAARATLAAELLLEMR